MMLHDFLFLLLTLTLVIGVPIYIYFRNKMVSDKNKNYSRQKVFKIAAINLLLTTSMYLIFLLAFFSITLQVETFLFRDILGVILFFIVSGFTFYGGGIYITSIILEQFTILNLKKSKHFKTQFIATHLFHGPISHVLIYSSYIVLLLILALFSLKTEMYAQPSLILAMFASGLLMGIMYAVAQIYNGTFPYQFITGTISLVIYLTLVNTSVQYTFFYTTATYFMGFIITFLSVSLTAIIYLYVKKKEIWDRSGY